MHSWAYSNGFLQLEQQVPLRSQGRTHSKWNMYSQFGIDMRAPSDISSSKQIAHPASFARLLRLWRTLVLIIRGSLAVMIKFVQSVIFRCPSPSSNLSYLVPASNQGLIISMFPARLPPSIIHVHFQKAHVMGVKISWQIGHWHSSATLKTVNPKGQITICPKASHSPFEHVPSALKPSTAALYGVVFFVNLIFIMEPVFSIPKKRPVDGLATAGQALVLSAWGSVDTHGSCGLQYARPPLNLATSWRVLPNTTLHSCNVLPSSSCLPSKINRCSHGFTP